MAVKPKIIVHSANIKSVELAGSVTIGEKTAARLNAEYKTDQYKAGDVIDLGRLAYHNNSWWKRVLGTLRIKKHILN